MFKKGSNLGFFNTSSMHKIDFSFAFKMFGEFPWSIIWITGAVSDIYKWPSSGSYCDQMNKFYIISFFFSFQHFLILFIFQSWSVSLKGIFHYGKKKNHKIPKQIY